MLPLEQLILQALRGRASNLPYRNEVSSPHLYLNTVNLSTVWPRFTGFLVSVFNCEWICSTCIYTAQWSSPARPPHKSESTFRNKRLWHGARFPLLTAPCILGCISQSNLPQQLVYKIQTLLQNVCNPCIHDLLICDNTSSTVQQEETEAFLKLFKQRWIQSFH